MNCPNCNNKCGKCGCNDAPLTTPNYVLPECATAETCSEIINTDCVVYTGDPIISGSTVIVNTNDTVSEALTSIVDNIPPYKVFRGLLTQTGTSAPTLTVLENTLGVSLTTFYAAVGSYQLIAPSNIFVLNKTYYNFQLNNFGSVQIYTLRAGLLATNSFQFNTFTEQITCCEVLTNGLLTNAPFEILVYA
jgi:hypothetical protein